MSSERSDVSFETPNIDYPAVANDNYGAVTQGLVADRKNRSISEKRFNPPAREDHFITGNTLLIFLFIIIVAMLIYLKLDTTDIKLDRTANQTTEKQLIQ